MPDAWSDYWDSAEADAQDGVCTGAAAELTEFWTARLDALLDAARPRNLIDMACGAAPVARRAADLAQARGAPFRQIVCADYAEPAIRRVDEAFRARGVSALVADAAASPFADGAFDLVVSQFGLEYAGEAAFADAARLVAPDGHLIVVSHLGGGPIHHECAANLVVLRRTLDADPIGKARALFEAAAQAEPGKATDDIERLEADLLDSFREVEAAVVGAPDAGGAARHLQRLIPDLATLYARRQAYHPDQVSAWIGHQAATLDAYLARMESMTRAALGEHAMESIRDRLAAAGLVEIRAENMVVRSGDGPAAWRLEARRPA